jgi:hypothetical protein
MIRTMQFVTGDKKINCIKVARQCFELGLREAKDLVESEAFRVTEIQLYALKWCFSEMGMDPDEYLAGYTPQEIIDLTGLR